MKNVTLVENTCGHEDCIAEHGLSLYVETKKHKLLLDTGQTDAVVPAFVLMKEIMGDKLIALHSGELITEQ